MDSCKLNKNRFGHPTKFLRATLNFTTKGARQDQNRTNCSTICRHIFCSNFKIISAPVIVDTYQIPSKTNSKFCGHQELPRQFRKVKRPDGPVFGRVNFALLNEQWWQSNALHVYNGQIITVDYAPTHGTNCISRECHDDDWNSDTGCRL